MKKSKKSLKNLKSRRGIKITYYFIDDPYVTTELSFINTRDKNYVKHTKKTVTIKVDLSDLWGAYCGSENRTYPREGYLKEFDFTEND